MTSYRFTQTLDRDKWSAFVREHPRGGVFQTPEMFDLLSETRNNQPGLAAVTDETGDIAALMVYAVQYEVTKWLGPLTARAVVRGGPLVSGNDQTVLQVLLEGYDKVIKRKIVYTQLRNAWEQDPKMAEVFKTNGYLYEDHLNILLDLEKSEEQLWKEVHSKRRNEIRRARKEGATTRELTNPGEIDTAYAILKDVYNRAKLPLHHKSMFDSAVKILGPKGMIRYFGAFVDEKLIGTIVALCYKDTIFDWYAGSYRQYYKKYPNDLLPWEVFLWGKENGYQQFDFGGAGKPGVPYGVRDYKKKFGGQLVNHGRYEKSHHPMVMKAAAAAFKLWRKLK